MLTKIIELFIAAVITFGFSRITKKLNAAEDSRQEQAEAFKEMQESIKGIKTELADLGRTIAEDRMITSRYRIIRFDDEEAEGRHHSDDHWDQVSEDIDTYSTYCSNHPEFHNHKGQTAMGRVKARDMERRQRHV